MGQLMSYQPLPQARPVRVLTDTEHHVPSYRIGQRVDGFGRLCRLRVGVHPHPAEVATEAWLEEGAGGGLERLAVRAQHVMHYWWHPLWFSTPGHPPLQLRLTFLAALLAFP